jgi:hypothetical protein
LSRAERDWAPGFAALADMLRVQRDLRDQKHVYDSVVAARGTGRADVMVGEQTVALSSRSRVRRS